MGATTLSLPTTTTQSTFHPESEQTGTIQLKGAELPASQQPSNPPKDEPNLLTPLETLLTTRHSTRAFLPTPVPKPLLHNALALAQNAPSNSNIQNWHFYLVSGNALTRLTDALMTAASESHPKIPPLPQKYAHFRSALGAKVYGQGYGIPRSDVAAKIEKERRNFKFFDAPVAGIVCMDRELAKHDAMAVGMWLQSLELGLLAQGIASCIQVSTAGYQDVVKKELGIGEDLEVLCGVAIGYEDEGEKVNGLRSGRDDWRTCTVEVE